MCDDDQDFIDKIDQLIKEAVKKKLDRIKKNADRAFPRLATLPREYRDKEAPAPHVLDFIHTILCDSNEESYQYLLDCMRDALYGYCPPQTLRTRRVLKFKGLVADERRVFFEILNKVFKSDLIKEHHDDDGKTSEPALITFHKRSEQEEEEDMIVSHRGVVACSEPTQKTRKLNTDSDKQLDFPVSKRRCGDKAYFSEVTRAIEEEGEDGEFVMFLLFPRP